MRIVHLSDIHFWRYAFHPLRLLSKRMLGTASLFLGRARRFRLERVPALIERVQSLDADHLLITGDLTTTALPGEFHHAKTALSALLHDPAKVTIIPGNHDRYTLRAHRSKRFEHYFGSFAPEGPYPWLRALDGRNAILGLDPTRAGISARGMLPRGQLLAAPALVDAKDSSINLVIACHYPVAAPPEHEPQARPQADRQRGGTRRLVADDRPAHLLLRSRARRLGLQTPRDSQPTLLESGRAADARPLRPQLTGVFGDHDRGAGRERPSPLLDEGDCWKATLLCREAGFFS